MNTDCKTTLNARAEAGRNDGDFSNRLLISYMVGIYVAINAVHDSFLLVEGPDCTHSKTQFMQGNQDYLSALTSVSGFHKIANTAMRTSQMHQSREDTIREMLMRMAQHEETGAVLFTSMPCLFITGVDYERICRDVYKKTGKEVIHIPGKSLSNDWLKGYEETLKAIAGQIIIRDESSAPSPKNVAIVGHLFDRNEEDNRGNTRELERLLKRLGLRLVSVWLSGQNYKQLGKIQEAGTIISFPYGRDAAKIMAQRLGARLIETELPFGLGATERWLRKLSGFFACESRAERCIEKELHCIVPKLEYVIPFLFQHKSFGYIGDPFLFQGFSETVDLLGGKLAYSVITNCKYHTRGLPFAGKKNILIEPRTQAMVDELNNIRQNNKMDCIVTNSLGLTFAHSHATATVEFGFPSYNTHCIYDRPYLGFNGFLAFMDTLANAMRISETFKLYATNV